MKLPEKYCLEMRELLGEDYQEYLESFGQPPKSGLRVNTLKISPETVFKNFRVGSQGCALDPQRILL